MDGKAYGLIFDVDGVIADTEAVNARATIRVFRDVLGLDGVIRQDFEAGLGRSAEEYVRAAARVHGRDLSGDEVARAVAARQEEFLRILRDEPLPPFPGVVELLEEALASGTIRVAIATSSTREKSRAVLEATGIPYQQVACITGSDVSRKKPDPELFLIAARRIDLAPARCVVIEDAPNGVEAARRAGCRVIAVTSSVGAAKLRGADRIVSSLEEVTAGDIVRLVADPSRPPAHAAEGLSP